MPNLTLSTVIGKDRDFPLTARNTNGEPAADLLISDGLTAAIWRGQDQTPLFAPEVEWIDPPNYRLRLLAADTAGFVPGYYRVQAYVSRGGRSAPILDAWLELVEAPGLAAQPATYCSAEDVRLHLPFGDHLLGEHTLAGFALQRGKAREYLDSLILGAGSGRGCPAGIGSLWYGVGYWGGPPYARDRTIKGYLDADQLVLTPAVVQATSLYAAYLVAKGSNNKDVRKRAAGLASEAEEAFACLVCEIDLDADGFGDVTIALGTTNFRGV